MSVSAADVADAEAIAGIWNPLIRDTVVTFTSTEKTLTELRTMIAERPAFVVAKSAGDVVGFASFAPFRGGPGYAHTMEHTVILGAAARGRGLGRALMAALEEQARAQGVHSLIGAVSGSNAGAVAFHRALGFAEAGVLTAAGWKFDRWHDLHLMQKLL